MDILLKQVRLNDDEELMDVGITDGKISAIEKEINEPATKIIEANGKVLVPGFVESHIHLDKALIASRKPNKSGTYKKQSR